MTAFASVAVRRDGPSSRPNFDLELASGVAFEVRQVVVVERFSTLFEIRLDVASRDPDIDLQQLMGDAASLAVAVDEEATRYFHGICRLARAASTELDGMSTYEVTIVPRLWLATQRRRYRVFQHASEIEIVTRILDEWGIRHTFRIDPDAYPKRMIRVQYDESDLDFVQRLLEDAGVSFFFESTREDSTMVLADAPQAAPPRSEPLPFFADPDHDQRGTPYVSRVRVGHELRPRSYVLMDVDVRRPGELMVHALGEGGSADPRLEQVDYPSGAFLVEGGGQDGTPQADDHGAYRASDLAGAVAARRRLEALSGDAQQIELLSNALDLAPGSVLSIEGHPRADLAADRPQLVVASRLAGRHDGDVDVIVTARSAERDYRPPRVTTKPRTRGVESATVVGPDGDEIHTDELGRVRVHFHWDRESRHDDRSSCWIPVSHPWAGAGFGQISLPRVGQEVLVDFLNGDPDRPVVVGRVFTRQQAVPYGLPANKTRSGWRSRSTPGGEGFNEIAFEDTAGAELVDIRAERDLEKLVRHDERETVGRRRTIEVGTEDELTVGQLHVTQVAGSTILEMRGSFVKLTNGMSTITMEGPTVTIDAQTIRLNAEQGMILATPGDLALSSARGNVSVSAGAGDVRINGGPMVKINT